MLLFVCVYLSSQGQGLSVSLTHWWRYQTGSKALILS